MVASCKAFIAESLRLEELASIEDECDWPLCPRRVALTVERARRRQRFLSMIELR